MEALCRPRFLLLGFRKSYRSDYFMKAPSYKTQRIIARIDADMAARIDQCVAAGRMFKPDLGRSEFLRSALEQAMATTPRP